MAQSASRIGSVERVFSDFFGIALASTRDVFLEFKKIMTDDLR